MSEPTDRFQTLSSGRLLDLERDRWDGVLDHEELEHCRRRAIPLSYDCAQIGWVSSRCRDDLADLERPTRKARAVPHRVETSAPAPAEDLIDLTDRTLRTVLDLTDRQTSSLGGEAHACLDAATARVADDRGPVPADGFRYAVRARLFAARTALLDPLTTTVQGATPTVEFRRWTEADAAVYRALLDNPRVWEHLPEPYPEPFTDEVALDLIDITRLEFHHDATAVIVDGEPVGQCVLRFDDAVGSGRAAEVSYWLGEEHWGRGLMSSILPLFTARGFERHPDVEVIYAWIAPENPASARVAERSGYHRDDCSLESLVAESIRRPGWERYVTYRSQW